MSPRFGCLKRRRCMTQWRCLVAKDSHKVNSTKMYKMQDDEAGLKPNVRRGRWGCRAWLQAASSPIRMHLLETIGGRCYSRGICRPTEGETRRVPLTTGHVETCTGYKSMSDPSVEASLSKYGAEYLTVLGCLWSRHCSRPRLAMSESRRSVHNPQPHFDQGSAYYLVRIWWMRGLRFETTRARSAPSFWSWALIGPSLWDQFELVAWSCHATNARGI